MEPVRLIGRWWLPTTPELAVGGVLEIDTSKPLLLQLTESLVKDDYSVGPVPTAPVIWGAAAGRSVTLLDCWLSGGSKLTVGQEVTRVQVLRTRVVLVGVHLDSGSDAAFDSGEVTITGLTAWATRRGISIVPFPERDSSVEVRMEAHRVDSLEADLTDSAHWKFSLDWHHPFNGQPTIDAISRSYSIVETLALRATSTTPQTWDAFQAPWTGVRDLVTVATRHPAAITSRTLWIDDASDGPPAKVALYYTTSDDTPRAIREFDPHEVIFPLAGDAFTEVLEKWFALRESLGLSLDLVLGVDYYRGGYYLNQLFDVASAAEGFHAALCPKSTDLAPDEHAAIKQLIRTVTRGCNERDRQQVLQALEDADVDKSLQDRVSRLLAGLSSRDHRSWVSNRVGDNRPGLHLRYVELATTKADPTAVKLLLTDVETWASWLRTARNAVGHVNADDLKKIPEDALFHLMSVTRALLLLVLLAELGLDTDTQQRLADDDGVWGHRARQFRHALQDAASSTNS
ncbi:hypothetical protein CIW52_06875 [Mycolicibacterium sp. P9-64]|nr:HEPN domain-containing protein [Mycolicibacterium sp. P9-64]KAA0085609.1 hypothetical protein CIW52_06875 [Mycolicibacterium sp. P9-64]